MRTTKRWSRMQDQAGQDLARLARVHIRSWEVDLRQNLWTWACMRYFRPKISTSKATSLSRSFDNGSLKTERTGWSRKGLRDALSGCQKAAMHSRGF